MSASSSARVAPARTRRAILRLSPATQGAIMKKMEAMKKGAIIRLMHENVASDGGIRIRADDSAMKLLMNVTIAHTVRRASSMMPDRASGGFVR